MRQVPASSMRSPDANVLAAHYLVVGDGRLARHLVHYLKLENLPFTQVSSRAPIAVGQATHVLLAVSDAAIAPVAERVRSLVSNRSLGSLARSIQFVHFSGALVLPDIPSAHPLMTFGTELYPLETYRTIAFVLEEGRARFDELLPGLSNSSFEIEAEKKPLYHALCSMSGNFTVLLWEKVFASFTRELGLPREVLFPYLVQTCANLMSSSSGASVLTGPLARGDFGTIEKHLKALSGDAFADVYRAFVKAHAGTQPTPFPFGGSV